jgi:hypothetical protein
MRVACSPDGRTVAASSFDGTLLTCDLLGERPPRSWKAHESAIAGLAFAGKDGATLASASDDRTIKLWDTASGSLWTRWQGRTGFRALAFSPDERRIVTASAQPLIGENRATAEIWDAATGRELATLRGHTDLVFHARFSPDGNRVATASFDGSARLSEAFPWIESDYPGDAAMPMAERVKLYAHNYWRRRLAAESAAGPRRVSENAVPGNRWPRSLWPARTDDTPKQCIDLINHYNAPSTPAGSGLRNGDADEDFSALPKGVVTPRTRRSTSAGRPTDLKKPDGARRIPR